MPNLKLQWGLQPPPEVEVAWGARAIYTLKCGPDKRVRVTRKGKVSFRTQAGKYEAVIDVVHDRCSIDGDPAAREKLYKVITKKLLPMLRKECLKQFITPESGVTIELVIDGYKIVASPRESYGYLYIVAYKAPSC